MIRVVAGSNPVGRPTIPPSHAGHPFIMTGADQKDKARNKDEDTSLRLASPTIYEIISEEGKEELNRPFHSLMWSAFVAGICISFSLIGEGIIQYYSPDAKPYFLLSNFGYTIGFLIVILGRFQLFTENTITVVLPLLEQFSLKTLQTIAALWGTVLTFNMLGTFAFALLITFFPFFSPELMTTFLDVSSHAVARDAGDIFLQAIPAGFLIAALVWMLPSANGAQFWVILLMTYLIAIGDFAHIVAGSAEAFLLVLNGQIFLLDCAMYLIAACAGNILGGTGLFALMAYAQVRKEI